MIANRIFAACCRFFRRWKPLPGRVTLIEKLNTGGTGSLYEVKRECDRRGYDFSYNVITHRDYEVRPSNIFRLLRLFTVKAYRMATSSYIFLNDNFMPMAYMDPAPETKIIQLWHGLGSYKKFGGSSETDPRVLEELKAANEHVDYIIAGSENIRSNYAEAFMVPESKIACIGCPQVDYYFRRHDLDHHRRKLDRRYPELAGKKLVLYAPTFREDEERDRHLLDHFDFERFSEALPEDCCLAIRLHPQIQKARVPDGVVDLTDYPNVRLLLCMTDILIADYSSIAVEYALLERPIILYAHDMDWYLKRDRGFYFDFEKTAPGPIARDMDQLIDCIRGRKWDIDKVRAFARLHNDFFDDNNASRLADLCFEGKTVEEILSSPEKKGDYKPMKIIAGLGNPTDQYKGTRHNIGYMVMDKISKESGIAVNRHRFHALCGLGFLGGQRVLLMKPLTYMNRSGESIREAADYYKVDPEDILVIYDDISLEPGLLRIRTKGSAGGHNGMKNIISHLGSEAFPRIRVGIGEKQHPDQDLADFVLGKFSPKEMEAIEAALEHGAKAAGLFAEDRLDEAMNRYSVGKKKRGKKAKAESQEESRPESPDRHEKKDTVPKPVPEADGGEA